MGDTGPMNEELRENVTTGGYVIDPHAVAAAMIVHERTRIGLALGVLVAPKVVDHAPVSAPQDESASFGDVA
jgi:hypothetical protein